MARRETRAGTSSAEQTRAGRSAPSGARAKTGAKRRLPLAAAEALGSARAAGPGAASTGQKPVPCLTCALCCSYIAVAIDGPDSLKSATEILWHLYHDHVSVYRDSDDEWMVQFETRCRHLQDDNRCAIYETRPHICRTYSQLTCEVNADDEGMSFYSPETFLQYLAQRSRRIYALVQKSYLPAPEQLAPRTLKGVRHPPSFEKRFQALRGQ